MICALTKEQQVALLSKVVDDINNGIIKSIPEYANYLFQLVNSSTSNPELGVTYAYLSVKALQNATSDVELLKKLPKEVMMELLSYVAAWDNNPELVIEDAKLLLTNVEEEGTQTESLDSREKVLRILEENKKRVKDSDTSTVANTDTEFYEVDDEVLYKRTSTVAREIKGEPFTEKERKADIVRKREASQLVQLTPNQLDAVYKHPQMLGREADAILNDIINGVKPTKPDRWTKASYDSFVKLFSEHVEKLKKAGYELYAKNNILISDSAKIAGTTDFTMYHVPSGKWVIIDLKVKTSSISGKQALSYHGHQLKIYKHIFKEQTGEDALLGLLVANANYTAHNPTIKGESVVVDNIWEIPTTAENPLWLPIKSEGVVEEAIERAVDGYFQNERLKAQENEELKGLTFDRSKMLKDFNETDVEKKAQEWILTNPIFQNLNLIEMGITHPDVWATWTTAGIRLYNDTKYSTLYHEAWHEFSQYYLTVEDKMQLYKEAAKYFGSNKSLKDLEEDLAEAFLNFATTGQMPQKIRSNNKIVAFFQELYDFLRYLFNNQDQISTYFNNLYKGQLQYYTKSSANLMFTGLNSSKNLTLGETEYSLVETGQLMKDADKIFIHYVREKQKVINSDPKYLENQVNIFTVIKHPDVQKIVARSVKTHYEGLLNVLSASAEKYAENSTRHSKILQELSVVSNIINNFDDFISWYYKNTEMIPDDYKSKKFSLSESLNNDEFTFDINASEINNKDLLDPAVKVLLSYLPQRNHDGEIIMDKRLGVPENVPFIEAYAKLLNQISGFSYERMLEILKTVSTPNNKRIQDKSRPYIPEAADLVKQLPKSIKLNSERLFITSFQKAFFLYRSRGKNIIGQVDEESGKLQLGVNDAMFPEILNLRREFDETFSSLPGDAKILDPQYNKYAIGGNLFSILPELQNFDDLMKLMDILNISYEGPKMEAYIEILKDNPTELNNLVLKVQPLHTGLIYRSLFNKFLEEKAQAVLEEDAKNQILALRFDLTYPLEAMSSTERIPEIYAVEFLSYLPESRKLPSIASLRSNFSYRKQAVDELLTFAANGRVVFKDDMVIDTNRNKLWEYRQMSYLHYFVKQINDSVKYPTFYDLAKDFPEINSVNNPYIINSYFLRKLFDSEGNRKKGKYPEKSEYVTLDLNPIYSVKVQDRAKKTIKLDQVSKLLFDVVSLNLYGIEERNRPADKSEVLFFKIENSPEGDNPIFFNKIDGRYVSEAYERFFDYLLSDFIYERDYAEEKLKNHTKHKNARDVVGNFLNPKTLQDLKNWFNEASLYDSYKNNDYRLLKTRNLISENLLPKDLWDRFRTELKDYLNEKSAEIQKDLAEAVDLKELKDFLPESLFEFQDRGYKSKMDLNEVLMTYIATSVANRIEQFKMFYGHPNNYASFGNVQKRLSAFSATGTFPQIDNPSLIDFILKNNTNALQKAFNPTVPADAERVKTIKYAVVNDLPSEWKEAPLFKESYNDKNSKATDAATLVTLDFYRRFYQLTTPWTDLDEKEYNRQARILDAYVKQNLEDLKAALNEGPYSSFGIKKLQNAGTALTENGKVWKYFHKTAFVPLLPSSYITSDGKATSNIKLMEMMANSDLDYIIFNTGTKNEEIGQPQTLVGENSSFNSLIATKIPIKFLKEQVVVEEKDYDEIIFATQFRKLVYRNLANDADAVAKYGEYSAIIKSLIDYDKQRFLNKFSNLDSAIEYLFEILENKDIPLKTKELLIKKDDGTLKYTLDAMLSGTSFEQAIVASAKRIIIKQEINGGQYVQSPWLTWGIENELGYYEVEDGKIKKAEIALSYSDKYEGLMRLTHKGRVIGDYDSKNRLTNLHSSIERLNKALADKNFLKKNEAKLTVIGVRIPVQGYNSMENFIIKHFLPKETGNTVIVPKQMVVKSGSDYDIDKLFLYQPHINPVTGALPLSNFKNYKSVLQKQELIREQIKQLRVVKEELMTFVKDKQLFKDAVKKELQENIEELELELTKAQMGIENDGEIDASLLGEKFNVQAVEQQVDTLEELNNKLKSLQTKKLKLYNEQLNRLRFTKKKAEAQIEAQEFVDNHPINLEIEELQNEIDKFSAKEVEQVEEPVVNEELNERIEELRDLLSSMKREGYSQIKERFYSKLKEVNESLKALGFEVDVRKWLSNQLVRNLSTSLQNPKILNELLEPNNQNLIDAFASISKKVIKNENFLTVMEPRYNNILFGLYAAKSTLGIAAKMNPASSVLQHYPMAVKAKSSRLVPFSFNFDPRYKKAISLSGENSLNITDVLLELFLKNNSMSENHAATIREYAKGNVNVSRIQSELISATVDVANNDSIARLNINEETAPVAQYLLIAGVNPIIVLSFFGNATVKKLTQKLINVKSPILRAINGLDKREVMYEELKKRTQEYSSNLAENFFGEESFGTDLTNPTVLASKILFYLRKEEGYSVNRFYEDLLTKTDSRARLALIASYILLKKFSENVTTLTTNFDFDTSSPITFVNHFQKASALKKLREESFFSDIDLNNMFRNSFISSFALTDVFDMNQTGRKNSEQIKNMFPLTTNKKYLGSILSLYNEGYNGMRIDKERVELDSLVQTFNRDFKLFLLQNFFKVDGVLLKDYAHPLIEIGSETHLQKTYQEIMKNLKGTNTGNFIFDNLVPITSKNEPYSAFGLKFLDTEYSTDEMAEIYQKGLNGEFELSYKVGKKVATINLLKEFFYKLQFVHLYQNGLGKSGRGSFVNILDEKIFVDELTNIITTQNVINLLPVFTDRFISQNPNLVSKFLRKSDIFKDYRIEDVAELTEAQMKLLESKEDYVSATMEESAIDENLDLNSDEGFDELEEGSETIAEEDGNTDDIKKEENNDFTPISSDINTAYEIGKELESMASIGFKNIETVEEALFEVAQQMNSSEFERESAISALGETITNIAIKWFPDAKVGDVFKSLTKENNIDKTPDNSIFVKDVKDLPSC